MNLETNTEIVNGNGTIKAINQRLEGACGNEVVDMLKNAKELASKMSEKQKEAINSRVVSKMEEFQSSKMFEDLSKDFNL